MTLDKFGITKLFPTKTNGLEWFNKWDNGHSRKINEGQYDSDDSKFFYDTGQPDIPLYIDGQGKAYTKSFSDSVRLYAKGNWLNTEMTVYTKYNKKMSDVICYSRSNHELNPSVPCGFGGYLVKWLHINDPTKNISIEVEPLHPIYHRHLAEVKWVPPSKDKYTGYKQMTRTVGGNKVKVEGYTNINGDKVTWTKATEFIFDGTNISIETGKYEPDRLACVNKGDKVANNLQASTLWLNSGAVCWARSNECDEVKFRYFSVREIDPL